MANALVLLAINFSLSVVPYLEDTVRLLILSYTTLHIPLSSKSSKGSIGIIIALGNVERHFSLNMHFY